MPLFELEASARGRRRVFLRAQLPLALGTIFVLAVVALSIPGQLSSSALQLGVGVIAVASVASIVLPWELWPKSSMIVVAAADLVGVALIRAELLPVLPSAGMLSIFPVLWLAYGFRRWVIVVAILGSLFITSFAFAYRGVWPSTPLAWANVITLPVLIVGVAIVVNIAAAQLRRNAQRLREASEAQALALRESRDNELLSRAILDTVNAGIAFYDADNKLVMANRLANGLTELVGFRLDQPPYAGENVLMADRATAIPFDQQIIPRALRGEEIADHVEWLGPADQQTAIMASSRRVHRDAGVLLGTVIVAYDITELAYAIDIREQFLANISHELRTPLTNITGYLEMLDDSVDPDDGQSRRYLEVVGRNADRLHDRIGELLSTTETSAPLKVAPEEIATILDDAIARVAPKADDRRQTLEVLQPTSRSRATVDGALLQRAFVEILDNAVTFSPPESVITVTHTDTDSGYTITVADHGPGITRGEQTRIFDRFYRTGYARTNAIPGFGLGLSLAKNAISAHQGRISVASTGAGTAITVSLPRSGVEVGAATD